MSDAHSFHVLKLKDYVELLFQKSQLNDFFLGMIKVAFTLYVFQGVVMVM